MRILAIMPSALPQEARFRTQYSTHLYMVVGWSSGDVMEAMILETDTPSTAAKVAAGSRRNISVYRAPLMYCGPTLKWAKIQAWHRIHMQDNKPEDLT